MRVLKTSWDGRPQTAAVSGRTLPVTPGNLIRPDRHCAKRRRLRPVDHELQIHVVVGQVHQVRGLERRVELPLQDLGVLEPEAEGNDGAGVAEDGASDLGLELRGVLVGEDHPDAVFPQLGQHVRERECREGLELIEVEKEVPARGLGRVGP